MEHATPRHVTSGSTAGNGVLYSFRADSYVTQQQRHCGIVLCGSVALRVVGGDEKGSLEI
jgi:hypothetical protein